jgi:hypothetical protein
VLFRSPPDRVKNDKAVTDAYLGEELVLTPGEKDADAPS